MLLVLVLAVHPPPSDPSSVVCPHLPAAHLPQWASDFLLHAVYDRDYKKRLQDVGRFTHRRAELERTAALGKSPMFTGVQAVYAERLALPPQALPPTPHEEQGLEKAAFAWIPVEDRCRTCDKVAGASTCLPTCLLPRGDWQGKAGGKESCRQSDVGCVASHTIGKQARGAFLELLPRRVCVAATAPCQLLRPAR
jgi:hypothetical protein